ncbi:MAG TPA: serine hydrolase domain-containing protein [Gemmatimonadaceae bacterium]|jgi:CubicO group peptidase (beta-lactamase class C family)
MSACPPLQFVRRLTTITIVLGAIAACGSDATTSAPPTNTTLVSSTPIAEGLDTAALTTLVTDATSQQSDAIVILRHGKVAYENHFGKADVPIYAASVSKSFVSLAYGYLLADGKLTSLDDKVTKYLPDFANSDPRKDAITLRMLLTHTSGLRPGQAQLVPTDVFTFAASEPLVFSPGTSWQYLNAGADLAGALVAKIGGEAIDTYLQRKLFTPLGITTAVWDHGAQNLPLASGAVGGLHIKAMDLAKVGQVILDGGKWNGTQLIPADYITLAETSSQNFETDYGLFWWRAQNGSSVELTSDLLAMWEGNGVSPTITAKVQSLVGVTYPSAQQLASAVQALLTSDEYGRLTAALLVGDHTPGYRIVWAPEFFGPYFDGYLGQYMFVVPSKQLVAVRMRAATPSDYASTTEVNSYPTFLSDAYRLVPATVTFVPSAAMLSRTRALPPQ